MNALASLLPDPERSLAIHSNPWLHYLTGSVREGQVLAGFRPGVFVLVVFDDRGVVLRSSTTPVPPGSGPAARQRLVFPAPPGSPDGLDHMNQTLRDLGFREQPIQVRPFRLDGINVGLREYPQEFERDLHRAVYGGQPLDEEQVEEITAWHEKGRSMLLWGEEQGVWPPVPVKTREELARPTDRLFRLRSDPEHFWLTGRLGARQVIVGAVDGAALAVSFDAAGVMTGWEQLEPTGGEVSDVYELLEHLQGPTGDPGTFAEGPISVREFVIPDHGVGLRLFPSGYYDELQEDPVKPEWLEELSFWEYSGEFVLHWGTEYQMSVTGSVSAT